MVCSSLSREQQLPAFARLLRLRREAAGLSRRKLAQQAQLSEATIKLIETARTQPTRSTLLRLLQVLDLGLAPSDLPLTRRGLPLQLLATLGPPLNCYLAPGFDSLRLVEDLQRTLAGVGGELDPSCLCLTHHSALGYLRYLHKSPQEQRRRQQLPLLELAEAIVANQQSSDLTVMALAPGDGRLEVRLIEHLYSTRLQAIGLWLLDCSQPLLTVAYHHASLLLAGLPGIDVRAVQGNFHQLPSYTELLSTTRNLQRQQLFVLLGTLSQLDNEVRFLRDTLGSIACPGDLLLLDVDLLSSTDRPTDSLSDTADRGRSCPAELAEWLVEALTSSRSPRCTDEQPMFQFAHDDTGLIRGSQAQCVIASLGRRDHRACQFVVLRSRCFPLQRVRELLRRSGWQAVCVIPTTGAFSPRGLALLCRRC
jgi:transcriptional regulator with XRE-family HTH domain